MSLYTLRATEGLTGEADCAGLVLAEHNGYMFSALALEQCGIKVRKVKHAINILQLPTHARGNTKQAH